MGRGGEWEFRPRPQPCGPLVGQRQSAVSLSPERLTGFPLAPLPLRCPISFVRAPLATLWWARLTPPAAQNGAARARAPTSGGLAPLRPQPGTRLPVSNMMLRETHQGTLPMQSVCRTVPLLWSPSHVRVQGQGALPRRDGVSSPSARLSSCWTQIDKRLTITTSTAQQPSAQIGSVEGRPASEAESVSTQHADKVASTCQDGEGIGQRRTGKHHEPAFWTRRKQLLVGFSLRDPAATWRRHAVSSISPLVSLLARSQQTTGVPMQLSTMHAQTIRCPL